MKQFSIFLIMFLLLCNPVPVLSQGVDDYLILEGVGVYELYTGILGRVFSGPPTKYSRSLSGGVLSGGDHFSEQDTSYAASYKEPGGNWPFVKVEVTQHSGGNSDQWLIHEVESGFRTYYGSPDESYVARQVGDQTIIALGSAGWVYRWISNNIVIEIEYQDSQMEKPEPLEVVQAYLAKFPSTLPEFTSADLRTDASKEKWIKDEMERRLWLGDKWFAWQEAGSSDVAETLREVNRSIEVFLNYREKYFGINADLEKESLYTLISNQNLQGMKDKLAEYKSWWATNKSGSINLP
ncbi:MAG: hypothetical protein KJ589_02165 [Proteobacteria bacterium]|nr:hypothetical protein [Pseudomonadota bacterium]